jgi:hypothetical protein
VLHSVFECSEELKLALFSSPAQPKGRLSQGQVPAIDTLLSLVSVEGTAAHRYPVSEAMMRGPEAARNVADAIHYFCLLHGRSPGVVDHALARTTDEAQRKILVMLADRFADERAFLAKLVVAVGPLPSTPGQANTETAVLAQHHAIDMLAQSDRAGCALGATVAVLTDWLAIRAVLNHAAERLSVETPDLALPNITKMRTLIGDLTMTPGMERALVFGGQQIVAQHHGLWDLLEARSIAREQALQ